MERDLVSVVLPVYNRENTINRAIESVLGQSYYNLELIIVDDASKDNTIKQIEKYTDSRIKIVRHEKQSGAGKARNTGIFLAKGRYIAFQDSDDEWLPNKLERQIAFMEKGDFKASFSPYKLYSKKECIVPPNYASLSTSKIREALRERNVIGTPTLIVEQNVFEEIGGFNENLPALQDYELAIRIAQRYEIGYIDDVLVNAYRIDECITNDSNAAIQANMMILKWHKDFLNIKNHLERCFVRQNIVSNKHIDWKELEKLLEIVCETPTERETVYKILIEFIHDKQRKIVNSMNAVYDQFEKQLVHKQFVIYGAGVIGKRTYESLKFKGLMPKYFVVTEMGEEKEIDSIPIIEFDRFKENPLPIIIAVSDKNQMDVVRNIQREASLQFVISPKSILW